MDITTLRGFERIIIVIGAIFIGYLGYRLYMNGASTGKNTLKTNFGDVSLILTGIGPGIFFMAFGSLVLVAALYFGGAQVKSLKKDTSSTGNRSEETIVSTKGINSGANECNTSVTIHSSGKESANINFDNNDNIDISKGDVIGVSWNINDDFNSKDLKFKIFHPGITTDFYERHVTSLAVNPDELLAGRLYVRWHFDSEKKLVGGKWSIELWCDRTRISSKQLTIIVNN